MLHPSVFDRCSDAPHRCLLIDLRVPSDPENIPLIECDNFDSFYLTYPKFTHYIYHATGKHCDEMNMVDKNRVNELRSSESDFFLNLQNRVVDLILNPIC